MPELKPFMHLEWAISSVIGFVPDAKTRRKWVRQGVNGVKLRTVSEKEFRANTDWVVQFIFRANSAKPPAEAIALDRNYLPRRAVVVCREVLGRPVSPSTISGWSKTGYRGVRLRTYSLGRFLLTTSEDVRIFATAVEAAKTVIKTVAPECEGRSEPEGQSNADLAHKAK